MSMSWADLLDWASSNGWLDDVYSLQEKLPLDDARYLLRQLARIEPPDRIHQLTAYQRWQEELGGGFHGMLPAQLADAELPVPHDVPNCLRTAHLLADVRAANEAALRQVNPNYAMAFRGKAFPLLEPKPHPEQWKLTLDLAGLRALLEALADDALTPARAREIASMVPFQEMLTHRRNLGYLPEPLIDTDGLATFIRHAASDDPLDRIWAWLSTQNLFDLADIARHRDDYERLIAQLASHAPAIEAHILGTIAPHAPESMKGSEFRDRVSFAVGWGIAGWATARTAGINIEHFKDDYGKLLTTLAHESVHRWQLWIGRPDGRRATSFEDLTEFPFADERDRSFYAILSYIMLEGTATFIAPSHAPEDRRASVERGVELLVECHRAVYEAGDSDRADELVNEGLRSNGPFYWLGEALARAIAEADGPTTIGEMLQRGAPSFVRRGLATAPDAVWRTRLDGAIGERLRLLAREMERHDGA